MLDQLPTELILSILVELVKQHPRSIGAVANVSKTLCAIANDDHLWREIAIRNFTQSYLPIGYWKQFVRKQVNCEHAWKSLALHSVILCVRNITLLGKADAKPNGCDNEGFLCTSTSYFRMCLLRSLSTWKIEAIYQIPNHSSSPWAATEYSMNNSDLIMIGYGQCVGVFRKDTSQYLYSAIPTDGSGSLYSYAVGHGCLYLGSGTTLQIFDIPTGNRASYIPVAAHSIMPLYQKNGLVLVTSRDSFDKLYLYDVRNRLLVATLSKAIVDYRYRVKLNYKDTLLLTRDSQHIKVFDFDLRSLSSLPLRATITPDIGFDRYEFEERTHRVVVGSTRGFAVYQVDADAYAANVPLVRSLAEASSVCITPWRVVAAGYSALRMHCPSILDLPKTQWWSTES